MASSIPTVITTLKALAATTYGTTVQIIQGQLGQYEFPVQLLFGNVDFVDSPITVGFPTNFKEDYTVACELYQHSGGTDLTGLVASTLAIYQQFRDAIYLDRSIGLPQPMTVWLGTGSVVSGFDTNGIAATVNFTINVTNVAQ